MTIGYIRVSTDKQCLENQRFEIIEYAKRKDLNIHLWIEETVSGTKRVESRELGKKMKHLKKGDILITTELSRLGRNLMHIMSFLNLCMEKGIVVLTIKEGYELGNNINSKVLAFAFGLSAEIERSLISMRTKEALEKKRAEGMTLGRPKGHKSCKYKLSGKENSIKQLLMNGYTIKEISHKFGVSRQTLRYFINQNPRFYKK